MLFDYRGLKGSDREGSGTPLQYSCPENPMGRGAWWAAVHAVAESRTRLRVLTFTHWRRKRQPTPVFLHGGSQGRGSPVGCRLWGCTESDTAAVTWQQRGQTALPTGGVCGMQPLSYGPHRSLPGGQIPVSASCGEVKGPERLRGEAVWAQELGDRAPRGALREVYPVQMAA